jgi:hypothetical protein
LVLIDHPLFTQDDRLFRRGWWDDENVRRHKDLLQALRDRPGAMVPQRLAFFWV